TPKTAPSCFSRQFELPLARSHTRAVVSGSRDKTARVWDLASGNSICLVKHEGAVFGVAFAPDGSTFATVGDDKLVHVWDSRTAAEVRSFSGHTRTVQAVAYSFDGLYLLSVSEDNTARRWELKVGTR